MTVERTISLPTELQELKTASRALVRSFGGQEAAAARLGTRQQRISDCCSNHTDAFPRLDEIAVLESETVGSIGHPHVTSALARQLGMAVVPLPTITATGRDLLHLFARQSKSNSVLAETILEAQGDGVISSAEAAQIEAAAETLVGIALTIRSEARMIQKENRQ